MAGEVRSPEAGAECLCSEARYDRDEGQVRLCPQAVRILEHDVISTRRPFEIGGERGPRSGLLTGRHPGHAQCGADLATAVGPLAPSSSMRSASARL